MTIFETIFAWVCGGFVVLALIVFVCATMNLVGDRLDEIDKHKEEKVK